MALTRQTAHCSRYLLDVCDEILILHPNNLPVRIFRSVVYSDHQQNDKAIDDISLVINARPGKSAPYYIRCAFYIHGGKYDQAKRDYLRGLKCQMRTDKKFKKDYPEDFISTAVMMNEQELNDIRRIADEEVKKLVRISMNLVKRWKGLSRPGKKSKR
jgi:hypothetical protein